MKHKLSMFLLDLLRTHIEVLIQSEVEHRVVDAMEHHTADFHTPIAPPAYDIIDSGNAGKYISTFIKKD